MLTLSIIGCGKVAKTMAYLWCKAEVVKIQDIINQSQESAESAVNFIEAGNALNAYEQLRPADIFIIGCNDDRIESCVAKLVKQKIINANTIIFHFSGAKSSHALSKVKKYGGKCASLHPVKSFAHPKTAITTFENTYCGLEGDNYACVTLTKLISTIGGICFTVDGSKKLTYHAASVFACNYMVALQELSLQAFEYSGIDRDLGMKILEPIVKETADNIFRLGPSDALTGPIARADGKLVAEQFLAMKEWDHESAELYRLLGKLSIELSKQKHIDKKTRKDLEAIKRLLEL